MGSRSSSAMDCVDDSKAKQMRRLRCVLIANRGECALRMLRTVARINSRGKGEQVIQAKGIYVAGDTSHKRALEKAGYACFEIESYTDANAIVELLNKERDIDMIWPGWGFLSESAAFAQRIESETNCVWIGPTSNNIASLGAKDSAIEMLEASVASAESGSRRCEFVLPSSNKVENSRDVLAWIDKMEADFKMSELFPLIVKPVSGGGGMGMRIIEKRCELDEFANLTIEDKNYKNDPIVRSREFASKHFDTCEVIVQKYVSNARHIEVQIFGDGKVHIHIFIY